MSCTSQSIRVAAVQMQSVLGDVEANLAQAVRLVHEALDAGARWVVLPEFFTTGMCFDEAVLHGDRPLEGGPVQTLQQLARDGDAVVGGSFLASSDGHVYNTFALSLPDGTVFTHDKDFPSGPVESAHYAAGEDQTFVAALRAFGMPMDGEVIPARRGNDGAGICALGDARVGTCLCWEQIRYRTAARLRGKVNAVLAGSAWYGLDPQVGFLALSRAELLALNAELLEMLQQAPGNLARLLGVPVVHANLVGNVRAHDFLGQPAEYVQQYLGESRIVDAHGQTLASRSAAEGEGVVVADISLEPVAPQDLPRDRFWIPALSTMLRDFWYNHGALGREYYLERSVPRRRAPRACPPPHKPAGNPVRAEGRRG